MKPRRCRKRHVSFVNIANALAMALFISVAITHRALVGFLRSNGMIGAGAISQMNRLSKSTSAARTRREPESKKSEMP